MTSEGTNSNNEPWAWLGLLKWSLQYSDGTTESPGTTPMSEEDKTFLEAVMKEGIIDESERMKFILKEMTAALEKYQSGTTEEEGGSDEGVGDLVELLEELRDIVEQIDYAKAFSAMKGVHFLLGCVQQREAVPAAIRTHCLGILSTLSQNNPPVQLQLLELESIRILSELYFAESDSTETNGTIQAKIMQALSASIRNHATAENVFQSVEQSTSLLEAAVSAPQATVNRRALFFLRALVTSDNATRQTVRKFAGAIAYCVDNYLGKDKDSDLREMTLDMISEVMAQEKSVNVILSRKNHIVATGVQIVPILRGAADDDAEDVEVELELWEKVISQLSRVEPDTEETPLLLTADPSEDPAQTLPQ